MTDIIQYNIVNVQSKLINYTNILPENVEQILNELSKMVVSQEEEGLEHIPMKRNERSFGSCKCNSERETRRFAKGLRSSSKLEKNV